jgi:hypothetical protein
MLWLIADQGGRLMFLCAFFLFTIRVSQTGEKFAVRPCLVVFALFAAIYFYWQQTIATAPPQLHFFGAVCVGTLAAGLFWRSAPIGTVMLCAGTIGNKVAVLANGGTMPVFVNKQDSLFEVVKRSVGHQVASESTYFSYLCDWIKVDDHSIVSIGDLLILFALYVAAIQLYLKVVKHSS